MKMEESIRVRPRDGSGSERVIYGVCCCETVGIQPENAGFSGSGQIIVRIPASVESRSCCGDQICRVGSYAWYTVAEVCDNRRQGSRLSHWKVVGKR